MSIAALGLLVEVEQLFAHLHHPKLRILDVSRESVFARLHIPQAISVSPRELVTSEDFVTGLLPSQERLQAFFTRLAISPDHHVVVYDDEGGAWAGRLLWNLHVAGFTQTSFLNGGIHAWLAASLPISNQTFLPEAVEQVFQVHDLSPCNYRIEYAELAVQVQQRDVQLWDCRSKEEYSGERLAARRGGHIPGALWYEWSSLFDRKNHLKLYPLTTIKQQLEQRGFHLSQPVVVYCQSHHRSGLAYIIARLLDWQVRVYDAAWSEWGNRLDSAVVNGELSS